LPSAQKREIALEAAAGVVVAGAAVVGALISRYRVARPDEYVVRTGISCPPPFNISCSSYSPSSGLGIEDIEVSKKAFQWPFQTYKYVKMEPRNYHFELRVSQLSHFLSVCHLLIIVAYF